jgi:predicted ATPase
MIQAKVFKPLSGKNGSGKVTVLDFDDYLKFNLHNQKIYFNNGYARLKGKYLHRIITNFDWEIVDHKDLNRLNNTKNNLRQSSHAKNLANTFNKNEKEKGVYIQKNGFYRSAIVLNKKHISLGNYKTIEEASAAYNAACILIYKDHYRKYNENNG